MKTSLAENLRVLMTRKLFEKITIKQICDETGVIRATFYNYFDDKYDCLNWIVHMDLMVDESREGKISAEEYFDAVFRKVNANRAFYRAAYQVIGQNSFEDMVKVNLAENLKLYLKYNRDPSFLPGYDSAFLAKYYAECINFVIRYYVFQAEGKQPREMTKIVWDLLTHAFNNSERK